MSVMSGLTRIYSWKGDAILNNRLIIIDLLKFQQHLGPQAGVTAEPEELGTTDH